LPDDILTTCELSNEIVGKSATEGFSPTPAAKRTGVSVAASDSGGPGAMLGLSAPPARLLADSMNWLSSSDNLATSTLIDFPCAVSSRTPAAAISINRACTVNFPSELVHVRSGESTTRIPVLPPCGQAFPTSETASMAITAPCIHDDGVLKDQLPMIDSRAIELRCQGKEETPEDGPSG
jgi:hypothetical protein